MPNSRGIWLQVFTPVFTGPTNAEDVIPQRMQTISQWLQSDNYWRLKNEVCHKISIYEYAPGTKTTIPDGGGDNAIEIKFPPHLRASVPKGLIARCHLLWALEQVDRMQQDRGNVVFACIDGSGAFHFDSIALLVDQFCSDPTVDVVLGRRPSDYSGMIRGRKEVEHFEEYLLLEQWPDKVKRAFSDDSLPQIGLLPDAQAGCWGFRLRSASRLALTAIGYEIEFDLVASAVEAGLRIRYSEPLMMPRLQRHSAVTAVAVEMSIRKLYFIEQKLGLTRRQVAERWSAFKTRFLDSDVLQSMLPGYEEALLTHCSRPN